MMFFEIILTKSALQGAYQECIALIGQKTVLKPFLTRPLIKIIS